MTDDRLFDLAYSFAAAFECNSAARQIVDHATGEALGQLFEPGKQPDDAALEDAIHWRAHHFGPMGKFETAIYRTAFFGTLAICRAADPQREPQ